MLRPDSLPATAIVTALVAFGAISTDLFLPSLPAIGREFGAGPDGVQLTLSVFLVGFACGQLVFGSLSDRLGRRPVLIGGLALYVAASLLCIFAPSLEWLVVGRFFQALGACCGVALGRAVVRDVHGRERAAKVLSYVSMAMALAPAVGPIIGGYVQTWLGWRANFGVLALFSVATLTAVLFCLPETNLWKESAGRGLRRALANYRILLGNGTYLGYVGLVTCAYSGIFAFISGSSFLFIEVMGLTPDDYGLCFAAVVLGYMAGTFLSGRLNHRLKLDQLVAIGAGVSLLGGLAGAAVSLAGHLSVVGIIGPMFVFLIGCGLVLPNSMAGAIGPFPEKAGAASALLGFIQMMVGAAVGIAVGHLHDETGLAMTGATALLALGGVLAAASLRRRKEQPEAG